MRTVTKSNTERDFFSFTSKPRKYADVLPVLARTRAVYTWHVHDSPYSFFGCKKIETIMFYEGINTKVFRRSIGFAIAVVVMSCSSSFEYTISVHAVHASADRNVCNIVVPNHFKYILASRQDLILTSVAHLRKRLS